MRGLLLLSDPFHAQMNPRRMLGEEAKLNMKIRWEETAESKDPPLLLSSAQLHLYRLRRQCEWVCVMGEGNAIAHALILAAQLPVDRLILIGDAALRIRHPDRRQRRINAFARRNLSLVTAEIICAGMGNKALRILSAGLGWHSGGLLCIRDAAELWQKREIFLTQPFQALCSLLD